MSAKLTFEFEPVEAEVLNTAIEKLWYDTRMELARMRDERSPDVTIVRMTEAQERIAHALWERLEKALNDIGDPSESNPLLRMARDPEYFDRISDALVTGRAVRALERPQCTTCQLRGESSSPAVFVARGACGLEWFECSEHDELDNAAETRRVSRVSFEEWLSRPRLTTPIRGD